MAGDSIDDYITSVAKALDLTIEDAWRPAVRSNLEISLRMARLVDEFPLPDASEPAGVFSA
jgi:1-carboxybiuret hydrolase subunit AtzG-like